MGNKNAPASTELDFNWGVVLFWTLVFQSWPPASDLWSEGYPVCQSPISIRKGFFFSFMGKCLFGKSVLSEWSHDSWSQWHNLHIVKLRLQGSTDGCCCTGLVCLFSLQHVWTFVTLQAQTLPPLSLPHPLHVCVTVWGFYFHQLPPWSLPGLRVSIPAWGLQHFHLLVTDGIAFSTSAWNLGIKSRSSLIKFSHHLLTCEKSPVGILSLSFQSSRLSLDRGVSWLSLGKKKRKTLSFSPPRSKLFLSADAVGRRDRAYQSKLNMADLFWGASVKRKFLQ